MRVAIAHQEPVQAARIGEMIAGFPEHGVCCVEPGLNALQAFSGDIDLVLWYPVRRDREALSELKSWISGSGCPVLLMCDSIQEASGFVFDAMNLGALDVIERDSDWNADREALGLKLRMIAGLLRPQPVRKHRGTLLIAIGASTGGPGIIAMILSQLPAGLPCSLVIVQHVDPQFRAGMADWLRKSCAMPLSTASDGQTPQPGHVYLSDTSAHLTLDRDGCFRYLSPTEADIHCPSVDVFFASLESFSRPGMAILLTGMGSDGARGMLALRKAGWQTIAQDRETSIVWGMPGAAVKAGAAQKVLEPEAISREIRQFVYSEYEKGATGDRERYDDEERRNAEHE